MPAPDSYSFTCGPGVIITDGSGVIIGARHRSRPAVNYLEEAGRVSADLADGPVQWRQVGWQADSDEVEAVWQADDRLRLAVRHTFAAGWGMRLVLANLTDATLSVDRARIALVGADGFAAWGLAAGAEAAYSLLPLAGNGPLLGGALKLGAVREIDPAGMHLDRIELAAGGRYIVVWQWDWYPQPRAFAAGRHPGVPTSSFILAGQSAKISAGSDVALLAPDGGLQVERDGETAELIPVVPGDHAVELRSSLGLVSYVLHCAPATADVLATLGTRLLAGDRTPAGVVRIDGAAAGLILQHGLSSGLDNVDEAADALDRLTTRLRAERGLDPLAVSYLCGEAVRVGDADLIEPAAAALGAAGTPQPGLGLAAVRLRVSSLVLGLDIGPVLDRLRELATPPAPDAESEEAHPGPAADALRQDIGRLELLCVLAPAKGKSADLTAMVALVGRLGTWLGGGLKGQAVRPLGLLQLAQLVAVLELLPEQLEPSFRRRWPCPPSELARRARAELLSRLASALPATEDPNPESAMEGWLAAGWLAVAQPPL
jgi:hypothetical protein